MKTALANEANTLPQREIAGLTGKTAGGMLWMASSNAVRTLLKIFFFFVLGNLLSPEDFGVVGAAAIVISFSTIISDLGVGQAIIYMPKLSDRSIASASTFSLLTGIVLSIVILVTSPFVSWFFDDDSITPVLALLSLIFVFRGISNVGEGLIRRDLRFKVLAIRETSVFFFTQACIGIPLALLGFGYWSLALAYIASELLRCIVIMNAEHRTKFGRLHFEDLSPLFNFGSGVSVATILNRFAIQADNLIVGRQLGLEVLGVYSRAYQLAAMPANSFGDVGSKVLFPALASINEDKVKVKRVFKGIVTSVATLTMPCSVLLAFAAPAWITYLLGPKWADIVIPFQVLALAIYFRLGYKVHGTVIKSLGSTTLLALLQLEYLVLISAGALIGAQFGLSGIATGVLLAVVTHYFCMAWGAGRLLEISIIQISLWHTRGAINCLAMFALAYICGQILPMDNLYFSLLFFALAAAYGITTALCKSPLLLQPQEVELFSKFIARKPRKQAKESESAEA